jgi:hypothetical protein
VTKDEKWCGKRKTLRRLTGKSGGLANAVISIDGPIGSKTPSPDAKVLLRQVGCEFQPHVVILPRGAALEITNEDAVLHNVRASDATGKTLFNIAQPVKGLRFTVGADKFTEPGMYAVSCDAGHPWMSGYVIVPEHEFYAITDETGSFELRDVPPGTYRIRMWHEGVAVDTGAGERTPGRYQYEEPYTQELDVRVIPGTVARVDFDLTLRGKSLTKK